IFTLWIFILIRTLLSVSPQERIANTGLLFITIIVGVFLIRSVLKEVSQREKIEKLAKDLEKSNERLEEANERLKELDKLKSEFVSLATHQIRSPLTAIKGYVSLIQEGDYGPISNEVKGALDVIQQSSNNLVTIVGDFLDVSRIEQGKMKYDFTKFDVQKLTQQVVTELKPNVEKRGLVLNFSYDEDKNYMTVGDLGKLKQVIGNIIDNSIKYTPKGHIDVAVVKPTENKILIRVSDTGVGINPNVIPKLFQKFSRASNANEVNILGTGLGLYVAKQMIEAHKGRVWAESEGEGKGSKFYIELPVTDKAPIA
ncbi:MAG: sensor signal transduction histidine kinase, partial [Candidatus Paceibacter sp.]|nr:sensor signal transduction histidine kinase [Candidatus Paceibacter sp.]